MKLVDNWKSFWKWRSMQAFAVLAALPIIWAVVPPEVTVLLSQYDWYPYLITVIAVLGAIGRLLQQSKEE